MPIYVVRGSDLSLSIVEADTRKDLFWNLEQAGVTDVMEVTFKKLTNPLFLSLEPKTNPIAPSVEKPDHLTRLTEQMTSLMNDNTFSDICVLIDGKRFDCHKCILGKVEYFRCLMSSQMKEVQGNVLVLKDVSAPVFAAVREYLYLCKMNWEGQDNIQFWYELIEYCHLICLEDLVKDLEQKIGGYISSQGWEWEFFADELNLKEMVDGIVLTENIRLTNLNQKMKELLFKEIIACTKSTHSPSKNRNFIKEIKEFNQEELAEECQERLFLDKNLDLMTNRFDLLLSNMESKTFHTNLMRLSQEIKESGMMSTLKFCPFHKIVSYIVDMEEASPVVMERSCHAIQVFSELGFPFDREQTRDYMEPGLYRHVIDSFRRSWFNSNAFHLAAIYGNIELMEAFIGAGVDPLAKIHHNGETLMHDLHKTLEIANCSGIEHANLERFAPAYEHQRERIRKVLTYLLEKTGYKHISDVPYAKIESGKIDEAYIDDIVEGLSTYEKTSLPFCFTECESETSFDSLREIGETIHPRVMEVVGEDPDELQLRKQIRQAIIKDIKESNQSIHPNVKMRKFTEFHESMEIVPQMDVGE